jgi:hypothetical protein
VIPTKPVAGFSAAAPRALTTTTGMAAVAGSARMAASTL